MAWVLLFGLIGFELGGQYTNVVTDLDDWFEHAAALLADQINLPRRRPRAR